MESVEGLEKDQKDRRPGFGAAEMGPILPAVSRRIKGAGLELLETQERKGWYAYVCR